MGLMTDQLNPAHAAQVMTESAIAPEVAAARGYRTLTGTGEDRDFLREAGFKPYVYDREDAYPALLVPSYNARGETAGYQVKTAVPRTRLKSDGERVAIKYETPSGAPLTVDVPPFTRERLPHLAEALWITEGMKKVDALVTQGRAALGLTGVFNWRNKLGTLGDWEEIPLKERGVILCFDADAASNRNVQLAMGRLGAWLKSRGAVVRYLVIPGETGGVPVKGVDDYFAAGGDLAALGNLLRDTPPGQQSGADASFTDAFLVEEAAAEALAGRFVWAPGLGWLAWNGRVWKDASEVEPLEAMRLWCKEQFDGVLFEQKEDPSKNLQPKITGWRSVLSRARLSGLVSLARGVEGVQRGAEEFDADPDLLNVANGVVDLRTGVLGPHDPALLLTRIADAEYRGPGYRHPDWDLALEALPPATRAYYQDRMGQSVTGYKAPDHKLVIAHGGGQNGKSTVVTTVLTTLGMETGYGKLISDRVLMANADAHPTELMDLRGIRYAVLEETPEARHLNPHRIKQSIGTAYITARHIRQDSVTFANVSSIFINTNHRPIVAETDHGTWRRLCLVTFPYTYRKRAEDIKGPMDRLAVPRLEFSHTDPAVRAAALTWMVAGAVAWYGRDRLMLDEPESVERDTRDWRASSDLVMAFTDDCLTFDPEGFVPGAEMMSHFNTWAAELGHRPWNDKTFASRFGSHDLFRDHSVANGRRTYQGRQQRGWSGVKLAAPAPADPAVTNPFTG